MRIINTQQMSKDDVFLCFSPLLKKFLVEVKGIVFVNEFSDKKTNKTCWIFLRNSFLNDALTEWKEKGLTGNKAY